MRLLISASMVLLVACGATQFNTHDPYADGGSGGGGDEMDAGTGGGAAGGGGGGGATGGGGGGATGGGGGGATGGGGGATGGGGGATGGGGGATGGGGGSTCSAANCASGCCANGVCQAGNTAAQCGKMGVACAVCPTATDICKADQTCGLDPTATWQIRVSEAEVAASKPSGSAWDTGGGAPDTIIGLWCPETEIDVTATMPKVDDDYFPTWSSGGCTATAAEFLADGLGFAADDVDGFLGGADDEITAYTVVPITEAQLRAGMKTLTSAGSLDSVTFRFTKQ